MDKTTLNKKIKDLFIVREDDGTYNLFGKYTIVPERTKLYKVNVLGEPEYYCFSSLRHAVTWCVYEKNNKKNELKRIYELDEIISGFEVTLGQITKMLNKVDKNDKPIFVAKIIEEKYKKQRALREMQQYINISRYWQGKMFAENMNKN